MQRTQRLLIGQFFYDVASSYRLAPHVPQCALYIWDRICEDKKDVTMAHAAAALLLAQKWSDTTVFRRLQVARFFSVSEADLERAESVMFDTFLSVRVLRADRGLTQVFRNHSTDMSTDAEKRVTAFFNMSLLLSCAKSSLFWRMTPLTRVCDLARRHAPT
jgi:hypothetical protein